jgi:short-subunit dehydrogenase
MNIQGRIALVTGASSGIGLATAKLLTQDGARVAIVARSQDELDAIAKDLPGSFAVAADLRHEIEARRMAGKVIEHYGAIDILVNNAGRNYASTLEGIDTENIREIFELNILTPVALMQEVIPIMRRHGGGAIVNISSGTILMPPFAGMSAYVASKRALATFGLVAREELKEDNIAVSTVYPYITITNFYKDTLNATSTEIPTGDGKIPPPDPAEHVAETILRAIASGEAEIFAHDWMKKRQAGGNATGRQ